MPKRPLASYGLGQMAQIENLPTKKPAPRKKRETGLES